MKARTLTLATLRKLDACKEYRADYKRITAAARDDYARAIAPAWDDYERTIAVAWAQAYINEQEGS